MIHLILGGARSGKSRHAEAIAKALSHPVTYIATARPLDDEMQQRIDHHRGQRPSEWRLVEEPIALAQQLKMIDQPQQIILIGRGYCQSAVSSCDLYCNCAATG